MIETLFGEILTTPAGCNCPHSAVVHGVNGGCRGGGCMCGWERDRQGALTAKTTGQPAYEVGRARKPLREKLRERGVLCHYCGDLAEGRDHVIPRSRGGRAIVYACNRCNQMKAAMMPEEMIAQCKKILAWHEARQVPVV